MHHNLENYQYRYWLQETTLSRPETDGSNELEENIIGQLVMNLTGFPMK